MSDVSVVEQVVAVEVADIGVDVVVSGPGTIVTIVEPATELTASADVPSVTALSEAVNVTALAEEVTVAVLEAATVVSPVTEEVTIVTAGVTGPQGVPGPQGSSGSQGEAGPPGPGGTTSVAFPQLTPSQTWDITHNFGSFPSVTVVDSAGTQVLGELQYVDANRLIIRFSAAFGGVAHLG